MHKLFIFVGMTVGSSVGWYLGMHWGLWTAFFISSAGSLVGVYAGWKVAERLR